MYEATIIMAKPAQTIPSTLAEKLRGVPVLKYTKLIQENIYLKVVSFRIVRIFIQKIYYRMRIRNI